MDEALAEADEFEAEAERAARAAMMAEAEAAAAAAEANSTSAQVQREMELAAAPPPPPEPAAATEGKSAGTGFFGSISGSSTVPSWSGLIGSAGLMDRTSLTGLQAKLKSAASDASGALKAAATDAGGAIKAASTEAARAAASAAKAAAASAGGEGLLKTTICEFLLISGQRAPDGASAEALSKMLRARGLQLVCRPSQGSSHALPGHRCGLPCGE